MATITRIQPRSNYFPMDNVLVDEYAEKVGALGIAVYNVLARYADRVTGICFPSIGTIAKKLKLGRTTVKKYLRILLNHGLIAISSRVSDEGDPTSNNYMLLDPSPEKVALRRRQLEALLTPQSETFTLAGGRSGDDLPPGLSATDPQSAADPEQSSLLNKKNRTTSDDAAPTKKQQTCPHPHEAIAHVTDGVIICHHCWGLLDENLTLISCRSADTEENTPAERVESEQVCAA